MENLMHVLVKLCLAKDGLNVTFLYYNITNVKAR
jgi:hypothetical protein